MNALEVNVLVLAYIGDSVYEYYVRRFLTGKGIGNVNDLQSASINYVSAKSQAKILMKLMDNNVFSDEEMAVIKRARNHKGVTHPKSCDIVTYKLATGLEALLGYLDITGNKERIDEIMSFILV